MLSRDLLTFATMVSSLTVVVGAAVDLDSDDYEVLADNEGKSDDSGTFHFKLMISWENRGTGSPARFAAARQRVHVGGGTETGGEKTPILCFAENFEKSQQDSLSVPLIAFHVIVLRPEI